MWNPQINPQKKLIQVNTKFQNKGIQTQQGSSRVVYDSINIDNIAVTGGRVTFFRQVGTRDFPLTNLTQNKFEVAESMIMQRMYFLVLTTVVENDQLCVTDVQTLEEAGLRHIYASNLDFYITNNRVIKELPLFSFKAEFNKFSKHENNENFPFDTDIAIPPLFEFRCELTIPCAPAFAGEEELQLQGGQYLMCAIEGPAAIQAPKTTF